MDNLRAHHTVDILAWGVRNRVHLFFLPPHTTHFLNPLDQEFFTVLKKKLQSFFDTNIFKISASRQPIANLLLRAAITATQHISADTVRRSFETAGICPFNKTLIMQKAMLNIGYIGSPETPYDAVVASMVSMIREVRAEDTAIEPRVERADVQEGRLYSGEELLSIATAKAERRAKAIQNKAARREQRRQAAAARAAAKTARAKARSAHMCRGPHDACRNIPSFRGGKSWVHCPHCEEYYLCPACRRSHSELLQNHIDQNHAQKHRHKIHSPPRKRYRPATIKWDTHPNK